MFNFLVILDLCMIKHLFVRKKMSKYMIPQNVVFTEIKKHRK